MAYISKITDLSGNTHILKSGPISVIGTQTTTTASWTGSIGIPSIYDGLTIEYYLPRTSASDVTLNLTLSDNTTTGAIPVYFNGTERLSTEFPAGSTIPLTYWSAGSISIDGTATSAAMWTCIAYADGDTLTYGVVPLVNSARVGEAVLCEEEEEEEEE